MNDKQTPTDAATPERLTCSDHGAVGNSGFDYKTAADFLSGKTVSDEALRKFVAASRGAHDGRAALHAKMLSLQGELASREAEIALLKRSLLDAEADAAAPQPPTAPATQQAGEMEVFGLQWPGEDRINLSTVFDTEAEALEYMQNRCDTPGIRLVRFSSKAPTAQSADSVPAVSDLPPLPAPDLRDVGTKPQEIKEFLKGYATEYARTAIAASARAADSVLEDAARLDYLHSTGSTIEMLPGEVDFYPMRFRVGGLHSAVSPNLREAIDAARKQGANHDR